MSLNASAEIRPTHTPALFAAAVRRCADLLRAGEVVALPTETVYGLAANALDPRAVARIFAIKGRPAHNPIQPCPKKDAVLLAMMANSTTWRNRSKANKTVQATLRV